MTNRRENFIRDFNAVMKKYGACIEVREGSCGYETVVDGIDFDFDYDDKAEAAKDRLPESIELRGRCVSEITI